MKKTKDVSLLQSFEGLSNTSEEALEKAVEFWRSGIDQKEIVTSLLESTKNLKHRIHSNYREISARIQSIICLQDKDIEFLLKEESQLQCRVLLEIAAFSGVRTSHWNLKFFDEADQKISSLGLLRLLPEEIARRQRVKDRAVGPVAMSELAARIIYGNPLESYRVRPPSGTLVTMFRISLNIPRCYESWFESEFQKWEKRQKHTNYRQAYSAKLAFQLGFDLSRMQIVRYQSSYEKLFPLSDLTFVK